MEKFPEITFIAYAICAVYALCCMLVARIKDLDFAGAGAGLVLWLSSAVLIAGSALWDTDEIVSFACIAGMLVLQLVLFCSCLSCLFTRSDPPEADVCMLPSTVSVVMAFICFWKALVPLLASLVPAAAVTVLAVVVIASILAASLLLFVFSYVFPETALTVFIVIIAVAVIIAAIVGFHCLYVNAFRA